MPLTRDFRETVMARVKSHPAFRGELIVEATNAFLMDDMETPYASGLSPLMHKTERPEQYPRSMLGMDKDKTIK